MKKYFIVYISLPILLSLGEEFCYKNSDGELCEKDITKDSKVFMF